MLFSNKKSMNIHLILKIKFLFSQLLKIIIVIFVLNIGLAAAISGKTNKQIEGTLPYILLDGVKVTTAGGLDGIKVPDDTSDTGYSFYVQNESDKALYPNAKVNKSSASQPIYVPEGTTFGGIESAVPILGNSDYPKLLLNKIIPFTQDDDGDAISSIYTSTSNGALSINWQGILDRSNSYYILGMVKNNDLLKPNITYKVTLSNPAFKLVTKGKPDTRNYLNASASYYIRVRNGNEVGVSYTSTDSASPTDRNVPGGSNWMKGLGAYEVQDTSNIAMNFPTTGFSESVFYLFLKNISVEDVIAANGSNVLPVSGSNFVSISLKEATNISPFEQTSALEVRFKGPTVNIPSTFVPAVFKIYSDANHTKVLYSFELGRWYWVSRSRLSQNSAKNLCTGNGYRLVDPNDLTNANYPAGGWTRGLPGNGNSNYMQLSYKNDAGRWVGGLFNEWGSAKSSGNGNTTLVTASGGSRFFYSVFSGGGSISKAGLSLLFYTICVSP